MAWIDDSLICASSARAAEAILKEINESRVNYGCLADPDKFEWCSTKPEPVVAAGGLLRWDGARVPAHLPDKYLAHRQRVQLRQTRLHLGQLQELKN